MSSESEAAVEAARAQHRQRQSLRGCAGCVYRWPDRTCRVEAPQVGRDGQASWPRTDGLGCGKWSPIYAPGRVRWESPIIDADKEVSNADKE